MNDKQGVPHSGKYVAYYRVSTKKQGASGLGLEAQREIVQTHLNGGDWEIIGEFTEMESGKRSDRNRPELRAALDLCEAQGAILVVAKLDRLTRNVPFLSRLMESSAKFIACDIPDFGNPSQNRFMLQLMANVAEYEASLISTRTKAALEASKKRGTVLGSPSPEIGSALGTKRVIEDADAYAAEVMVVIKELQKYGCDTLQKIANGLMARGIETARGGTKWYPSSVRNVMNRSRDQ
jgi:DNA invertase Pin-like site-specific DNA recombinase